MTPNRNSDAGLLAAIADCSDEHLLSALSVLQREPQAEQHTICEIIRTLVAELPKVGIVTAFELIVAIGEHFERESLR